MEFDIFSLEPLMSLTYQTRDSSDKYEHNFSPLFIHQRSRRHKIQIKRDFPLTLVHIKSLINNKFQQNQSNECFPMFAFEKFALHISNISNYL